MGFMDKAKKLAEQAQQKLDEAQKNFNQPSSPDARQQGGGVKYDEHGRPIQDAPPAGATAPPRRARRPGGAGEPAEPRSGPPRTSRPPPPTRRRRRRRRQRLSRPVQADPVVAERFSRDSMSLGGILTAMVTPFDADGGLDEDAAVRLCITCWRTAPTASCWPEAPARARRSPTTRRRALWELGVAESGDGADDRRHRHLRHPPLRRAHRARARDRAWTPCWWSRRTT